MESDDIKSGVEVVREFLASLAGNSTIDPRVVASIQRLVDSERLSKQQLLRSLEGLRQVPKSA